MILDWLFLILILVFKISYQGFEPSIINTVIIIRLVKDILGRHLEGHRQTRSKIAKDVLKS
jgi:hypothetical protein